jgi:hypothetical protein
MKWTPAELRAIAEGEQAADEPGVIPKDMFGDQRAAWRQGYARGWNCLADSRQVDLPQHRCAKSAWRAGWQVGYKVCAHAEKGYTREVHGQMLDAAGEFDGADQRCWSQAQIDAYDDGVVCGLRGLIPMPTKRYQGRLIAFASIWNLGWAVGLDLLRQIHAERSRRRLEKAAQEAQRVEAIPENDRASKSDTRLTGTERQRAYRRRRRLVTIEISGETHELLRQLCMREGTSNEELLRSLLEAAHGLSGLSGAFMCREVEVD